MRNALIAAALGAVAVLPSVAAAEDAAVTLKKFGLLGKFSKDCSQPSSMANQFTHYEAQPDGTVALAYDAAGSKSTYVVNSATIISPSVIVMNEISGDGRPFQVMLTLDGKRIRVIESRDPDSGRVYIAAGRLTANNRESNWETRCK